LNDLKNNDLPFLFEGLPIKFYMIILSNYLSTPSKINGVDFLSRNPRFGQIDRILIKGLFWEKGSLSLDS